MEVRGNREIFLEQGILKMEAGFFLEYQLPGEIVR